jgi:FkbM family methyltransferase
LSTPDKIEILPQRDIALIKGDCSACSWVREVGRLDWDFGMLGRILPLIPPDSIVIDAGAFIGDHTAAYLTRSTTVLAFEPNPIAYQCLRYNCPDAHNYNIGLGDAEGQLYWTRVFPNCGGSFLSAERSEGAISIQVMPLDQFPLPQGRVGFIKADIEGMELKFLRGAECVIRRYHPAMCLEVNGAALKRNHATAAELVGLLHRWGYKTEPVHPGAEQDDQWDCIAITMSPDKKR